MTTLENILNYHDLPIHPPSSKTNTDGSTVCTKQPPRSRKFSNWLACPFSGRPKHSLHSLTTHYIFSFHQQQHQATMKDRIRDLMLLWSLALHRWVSFGGMQIVCVGRVEWQDGAYSYVQFVPKGTWKSTNFKRNNPPSATTAEQCLLRPLMVAFLWKEVLSDGTLV